jgi:ZIP family zinc transporter
MRIIIFSALAGICGMGLGGLITVMFKAHSGRTMSWVLSFAAGVMVGIVCFGLVPESLILTGTPLTVAGLVLGVAVILLLNRAIDALTHSGKALHQTAEELYHAGGVLGNQKALLRSGSVMIAAIALHNIPEGMAIGAGGSHDAALGAMLALMISLHNIPEGMAVAAPLIAGGLSKGKAVLLTAFAGATTLIGGVAGVLFGSLSNTAVALSLSAAGGAMLYVVFGEIIPQAVVATRSRTATIITLAGVIAGMLVAML